MKQDSSHQANGAVTLKSETPHGNHAPHDAIAVSDPVWETLVEEARVEMACECDSALLPYLNRMVLVPATLEESLAGILATKLATDYVDVEHLKNHMLKVFRISPSIQAGIRRDLQAVNERDPVAGGLLKPFVFFKGFQSLQTHRVAHWYWNEGDKFLAMFLQNRSSEIFGVDIHPAARIGNGILFDHATSIVVGETAVIEDNVSILHEVTLGGTGKQSGDRHPKVRQGVLIGAGAKILGNVEIGAGAKIGAGSVVLDPVPAHCTVAGVPAKIVAQKATCVPALDMDQRFPHQYHYEDGSGI